MSNSRVRIIKDPEERKQEIIEAALHLFSQKGYEHTTIQDIAKYLNISQGLCYRYFKSKAEIFTATAEFYAQQILIQIRQPFPENMKAIDKFNVTIKRLFQYIIKHGEFEANSEVSALRADAAAPVASETQDLFLINVDLVGVWGGFSGRSIPSCLVRQADTVEEGLHTMVGEVASSKDGAHACSIDWLADGKGLGAPIVVLIPAASSASWDRLICAIVVSRSRPSACSASS